MTRKFAVTLFATSLTLIGCGSTSTTKQDTAVAADGQAADVVVQNPDVVSAPDTAPVTPDTRPDVVTPQPEAGRDVAVVDAPNTDAGVDAANAGDGADADGGTSDGGDGGQG